MKKFRIVKSIESGEDEIIDTYHTYLEASRANDDLVGLGYYSTHIEGYINGEWYGLV